MNYNSGSYDDYDDNYYSYSSDIDYQRKKPSEKRKIIMPLIEIIQEHDRLLLNLKKNGGDIKTLKKITSILKKPIYFGTEYFSQTEVTLESPEKINRIFREIGAGDYFLDVRLTSYGFACYYLCRKKNAYWDGYNTIIEDIYQSPDYHIIDPHFIKLMHWGHEKYHLRLSQFRDKTRALFPSDDDKDELKRDNYLNNLSKYIFQSAWNESQQLAMLTSLHFGLPVFRQAIELIYLILSGELCDIRSNSDEQIKFFFETIYKQPAILALINNLDKIEGRALTDLNTLALKSYKNLIMEFVKLLKIEVNWGIIKSVHPLLNILLSNFKRLDYVSGKLKDEDGVKEAARKLEAASQKIIDGIIQ